MIIDYTQRALVAKIAYRGPGLSGRTENIKRIAAGTLPELVLSGDREGAYRGPVFSATGDDRVLMFHMRMQGLDVGGFGLNKRDVPEAMPVDAMQSDLRTAEIAPRYVEAVAPTGQGAFETLKAAVLPIALAARKRLAG